MSEDNADTVLQFLDYRRLEPCIAHTPKRRVQALANVLVRGIGQFVEQPNDLRITRVALLEYVFDCDVPRKLAGAYNLDTIVIDVDMDVIFNAIIAMKYRVCDNLMNCHRRITQRFITATDLIGNACHNLESGFPSALNHKLEWPLDGSRCSFQIVALIVFLGSFQSGNFNGALR